MVFTNNFYRIKYNNFKLNQTKTIQIFQNKFFYSINTTFTNREL